MTAGDLASMVVDLTRELSETRRELDAWRLVAIEAAHYGHERHVQYSRLEERYYRFLKEQRGIDREAVELTAEAAACDAEAA